MLKFMNHAGRVLAGLILLIILLCCIGSFCGCFSYQKRTYVPRFPSELHGKESFVPYSASWWCLKQWTFTYARSASEFERDLELQIMILSWPLWIVDWPFEVAFDTLALPHDIWWTCARPDIQQAKEYRYLTEELRKARNDAYEAKQAIYALTNKVEEVKK